MCWEEKRAAQWTHAVSCSSAFRASDPFSFSELQDDDDDGSFGARSYKIWDVHGEEEEGLLHRHLTWNCWPLSKTKDSKIGVCVCVCVWTSPDLNFLIRENEITLFCVFLLRPWATTNYTYGGLLIIVVDTWFSSSFVCIIRLPCGTPSKDLFFWKIWIFFFLRDLSIWQRRVSRKLQGKKKWRSLKINIIE